MAKYDLDKKDADINGFTEKALSNEDLLPELMDGILPKDNIIRSNSFRTLLLISDDKPDFLYP
jgi:hypothetical protein